MDYKVLINSETIKKIELYLTYLKKGNKAGKLLEKELEGKDLTNLNWQSFLQALFFTKKPQFFAESKVYGNGQDWPDIKTIYFDPYHECTNERFEIGNISLRVRPLTHGNEN